MVPGMANRPATIVQADIARIIRAAKAAGASTVEFPLPGGQVVVVRLKDPDEKNKHFENGDIVL
jgi:hypothetical protein